MDAMYMQILPRFNVGADFESYAYSEVNENPKTPTVTHVQLKCYEEDLQRLVGIFVFNGAVNITITKEA